jgi:hypothetical protein
MNRHFLSSRRMKGFWSYVMIFTIAAFLGNVIVKITQGTEIDFYRAFAASLAIGVMLAFLLSLQFRRKKSHE